MNFEEAREYLKEGQKGHALVAAQMVRWHPAELSVMLLILQTAKRVRYPPPHPDYWNALQACVESEGEPSQKVARFDRAWCKRTIGEAERVLEAIRWIVREEEEEGEQTG